MSMVTTEPDQAELFSRQEMAKLAPPTARQVLDALADGKWDFRTIDGITKETGLSVAQVKQVLDSYPKFVRRSPVRDRSGRALYTLRARGMKGPERMALIRLLITKTP